MMNRVHTGFQPMVRGTEHRGLSTLLVAAVAIAMFVIGVALFYWLSSRSTKVTNGILPNSGQLQSGASFTVCTDPTIHYRAGRSVNS